MAARALTYGEAHVAQGGRRWRFDHAAVARVAREDFDVRDPVHLRRRARRADPRTGLYTVALDTDGWTVWQNGVHEVLICPRAGSSFVQVLRTLAHELHHAWQGELYENETAWSEAYIAGRKLAPPGCPELNPFEIDADRAAHARWDALLPCVRIGGRA